MFIIEYEQYGFPQRIISQDVKDVRDIIVGIANDINTEDEAYKWVCNAHFGDNFVNQKYKFVIRCVYNENSVYLPGDSRNKQPDIFRNQRKLQVIANEITKQTGIKNEFIGEDNDSLTWDFALGVSYMKNMNGQGLYFALNDDSGKEICTVKDVNGKEFIRKTVTVIKRFIQSRNKSTGKETWITRNEDILTYMEEAIAKKKEMHKRIYFDGCWWIDVERHPYGQIRFWVGYEDKRTGNSNGSLYTIYRFEGNVKYSCEFPVKKRVADKLISTFKYLESKGLIK